ncbi:MAG: YidC/Oxa1 family membrane protein insertase [Candidatus Gracilibacteria bacterium]|jgi:YidC/Oxa1 family membrane protein insertase
MDLSKINNIVKNVVVFLAVLLIVNYIMGSCQNKNTEVVAPSGVVIFETTKTEYARTTTVAINIKNNTAQEITIPNECPAEPFTVYKYEANNWIAKTASPNLDCSSSKEIKIPAGGKSTVPYNNWNHSLFGEMGRFKIEFKTTIADKEETLTTPEFTVVKEGLFSQVWRGVFYRPLYNILIFFANILPGHDLGFAIILLTILIRTILIAPAQKSMKEQRKMQELQPRLNKIKEQYKGDQQKIASETMALWKEAKVSPFGSCLPILMQFPFLIAVFWVIRDGLNPDNSYLLYKTYANFTLHDIGVNFLGILDLTKVNFYVLPLIIGGLQFVQMKLSLAGKAKKQDDKDEKKQKNEMEMANSMMIYMMPVMIAVFTASVPAGVGLYWGISTVYGIFQQMIINKSPIHETKNEPYVREKVIS